jgi:hypothetical protein
MALIIECALVRQEKTLAGTIAVNAALELS